MFISDKSMKLLLETGLPADKLVEIIQSLRADEEASTPVRPTNADRQRRYRERQRVTVSVTEHNENITDHNAVTVPPSPSSLSPRPPNLTTPTPPDITTRPRKAGDFDRFWEAYPAKVGKRAAAAAFVQATKRIPDADPVGQMLAGIARAQQTKRWREGFVPNPATWLNQDRWLDGLGPTRPPPDPTKSPATPSETARRVQHWQDTGEWRPEWGQHPAKAAA